MTKSDKTIADISVRISEIAQTADVLELAVLGGSFDDSPAGLAGPLAVMARDLRATSNLLDTLERPKLRAVQAERA